MASPKAGLEKWQIRRLDELGITDWKDADDAKAKLSDALKAKAKAKESAQKSGFAAIDAKVEDKPAAAVVKSDKSHTVEKVEVLPATQTVDVTAPTINVHVPAPSVTVHADQFKWFPAFKAAFNWAQAAVIGAAVYAAIGSRLGELVTLAMK